MILGHVQRYAQNFELPFGDFQIDLIWYRDLAILGPLALDNLLVRETKVLSWFIVRGPQALSLWVCRAWLAAFLREAGSCRNGGRAALGAAGPHNFLLCWLGARGPWQLCASSYKGLLRKLFFCLHPLMY